MQLGISKLEKMRLNKIADDIMNQIRVITLIHFFKNRVVFV